MKVMTMCNEREKLVAYLYDEADASERRAVEAHLAECETCRDELGAFRGVREDLLAWDVPPHESVWKPFVTARPEPMWRHVPAWSLAAAATLVFAIGGAGGFAARAIAARIETPAPAMAAAQPVAQPAGVMATPDSVRALEARLSALEQSSAARPVAMSSRPAATDDAALMARVEQLIRDSEGRVNHRTSQKILSIIEEMDRQRSSDTAMLMQQINDVQERTNGSILTVKNMRSEKEK